MKRVALAVALLIGLATPSQADYRDGLDAYLRGDYATALQEFKPLAEQGNSDLQVVQAPRPLREGEKVVPIPEDPAEAVKWYRKAAEQGNAWAQYVLGGMYDYGRGVPRDYAEAVRWYRKAAEQGYVEAQNKLGFMYYDGRGVPQDYAEAVRWYRKAAEQGLAMAQHNLGAMFENGRGVPQDYVRAHMWVNLAASRSPPGSMGRNFAVENRRILAKKMTPAQIAEAQRLAREWKPKPE